MRTAPRILLCLALLVAPGWTAPPASRIVMPYRQAGLDPRQAAAHLLSRFSFGARPGEIDRVVREGPEAWFARQLQADQQDRELTERLSRYRSLGMTGEQIASNYMDGGVLLRMARQVGVVQDKKDRKEAQTREAVRDYAMEKGIRTARELGGELFAQKVVRAVYSPNQLQEVMTDFWFNHFNVSLTKNQCRVHVLSYERDAIRPNALGDFRSLLAATAKHPAMLLYLDNAQSLAAPGTQTLAEMPGALQRRVQKNGKRKLGINENFARELMELHTLGVDGGYTQKDVTEVARALTGWTTYPRGPRAERFRDQLQRARDRGVEVIEKDGFVFMPYVHDAGAKTILGRAFPAGRGMQEGEEILTLLSRHPSTARRIARKLAARFVSDEPDPKLVDRLAKRFTATNGDTRELLIILVESPEFWSSQSRRAKIKSPFEYVVSSVRGLGAEVDNPQRDLYNWLEKMGQPVYSYQAPTGFPDKAETWINSGTLVNRINFAFALVSNRVRGVHWNAGPSNGEEMARQLLTGRDWQATLKEANSTLNNPKFFDQIQDSEGKLSPARLTRDVKLVGILVSSPEFQRR